jgi:hypothetical protein
MWLAGDASLSRPFWRMKCGLRSAAVLPDGQFAHIRHAQIARRVILSQRFCIAEIGKSLA